MSVEAGGAEKRKTRLPVFCSSRLTTPSVTPGRAKAEPSAITATDARSAFPGSVGREGWNGGSPHAADNAANRATLSGEERGVITDRERR